MFSNGEYTMAAEANVQTKAGITFVDDNYGSDSSDSTSNSSVRSSPKIETTVKPKGRYPSTGELVKKSLSISGILILMYVLLFFWSKRKKTTNEKEAK
nr:LPXTG cell wall anchor domain-containing protein [Enterococcus sp. DIV0212c]